MLAVLFFEELDGSSFPVDVQVMFSSTSGEASCGGMTWQDASFGENIERESQTIAQARLAVERSSSSDVPVLPDSESHDDGMVTGGDDPTHALLSAQELLDGLREQYLQALYISKVSVPGTRFSTTTEVMLPTDLT